MAETSLIQWQKAKYWTRDFNPAIGCRPISAACANCWAKAWADRFGQSFAPHLASKQNPPMSGVVFCGNLTDLFGEWMETAQIWGYFSRLWHFKSPHGSPVPNDAVYLFCTKRVGRMCKVLEPYAEIGNAFFGFTAENQEWYDRRVGELKASGIGKDRFWVSAEPLLGPIRLGLDDQFLRERISWVVVGAESGKQRRPCELSWIEDIVSQCIMAGVPVFVKQICLPASGKFTNNINDFPAHLRIRQVPWAAKGREWT